MNHFKFLSFFVFLMTIAFTVNAKEVKEGLIYGNDAVKQQFDIVKPNSPDTVLKENSSTDLAQLIPGKWELAPNKRASEGYIIFDPKGSYEMFEKLQDGTGVTKKGEYLLYRDVSPVKIDICLGKCNQAGSEWTSLFGIIRALSNNKIEIRVSADGNRPTEFSEDKSEEGTMILSRTK